MLFLTAIAFAGCQKQDETPVQPDKVVVTVSSPHAGQIYTKGDTVNIQAHVSYISQLHGYEVKITDKNSGETLYSNISHIHGSEFDVNYKWINTLDQDADLKLEIETIIDHENNKSEYELDFKSQR